MRYKLLLILLFLIPVAYAFNPDYNTTAYYTMDNADISGTTLYDTAKNNDATLNNGVTTGLTGIVSQSIDCDGIDDYVNIPDFTLGDTATHTKFSISFWFKADDNTEETIISQFGSGSDGWLIKKSGSSQIETYIYATDNDRKIYRVPYTQNTSWVHYTLTFDTNVLNIYLDGDNQTPVKAEDTVQTDFKNSNRPIHICDLNGAQKFGGSIDEVSFYNESLSKDEVLHIHIAQKINHSQYPFTEEPIPYYINISTPLNNSMFNSSPIDFNFTLNYATNECRLYRNDTLRDTLTNTIIPTTQKYIVSAYKMENNANDYNNLNNGTLNGGASYVASKGSNNTGNYSIDFDGVNDYINVPDSNSLSFINTSGDTKLLISAWINPDDITKFRIANKQNEYHLSGIDTDALFLGLYSSTTANSIAVKTNTLWTSLENTWIHVLTYYSGCMDYSCIQIWVNGVNQSLTSISQGVYTGMVNQATPLTIGKRNVDNTYANGRIDEVYLIKPNESIGASDIMDLYNNGLPNLQAENINISETLTLQDNIAEETIDIFEYYINCTDTFTTTYKSNILQISYNSDFFPPTITLINPESITNKSYNKPTWINWTTSEPAECDINISDFVLQIDTGTYFAYNQTNKTLEGFYAGRINCTDEIGNTNYTDFYFSIDLIEPTINFIFPDEGNTSIVDINEVFDTNIVIEDNNLYAYEFLVYSPFHELYLNHTLEELGQNQITLIKSILPNMTGNWTIELTASDSHTKKDIEDYKFTKKADNKGALFEFEKIKNYKKKYYNVSIDYKGTTAVKDMVIVKARDRYNFGWEFDYKSNQKVKNTEKFTVSCPGIVLIENSEYAPHFVCGDNWIDFKHPLITEYEIYECGTDCYAVELELDRTNGDIFIFESIGGLNFNHKSVQFEVKPLQKITPFLEIGTCPTDSLMSVLMFIFIFAAVITLLIICYSIIRVPIITILAWISLMIFSYSFLGCSLPIGLIMAGISLIGTISAALQGW